MNSIRSIIIAACAAGGFLSSSMPLRAQTDCQAVAARLKGMVSSVPEHVLTAVEDTLVASPECVCEIVKTAIEASKADAEKVRQIVYVAVTTAPESAPAIAECAVAAAPEYADSVRSAFAEAFEDNGGGNKTAPSKKPTRIAKAPKSQKAEPTQMASNATPKPQTTGRFGYKGEQTYTGGGKDVVWESGKQVVEPYGGKTVAAGPASDAPGMEGAGMGGQQEVVEPPLPGERSPYAYAGQTNAPGYSSSSVYGGTAIDLSGIYLIPPVASAGPLFIEEEPEEKRRTTAPGGSSSLSPRRPIVRPPTMSPTGP